MKRRLSLLLLLVAASVAPSGLRAAEPIRRGGGGTESLTREHPSPNGAFGLSKFSVRHSKPMGIATLGSLLGVGHVTGWFSGAFELDVIHEALPQTGVRAATRQRCSASCDVAIDPPGSGQVLVLSGFQFQARDGFKRDIKSIWVRPDPAKGVINVGLNGAQPFEFDATVQYTYVPASTLVGGRAFKGAKVSEGGGKRIRIDFAPLKGNYGRSLIHSFELAVPAARPINKIAIAAIRESVVLNFDDSKLSSFKATASIARLKK